MRTAIFLILILSLTSVSSAASITATASGQRYEGKPPRPSRTVAQGAIEVFDAGEAYNFDGLGNTYVVGNGIAFAYGTASDFTLEVDTASFEPLPPPPPQNLSVWTSVSASFTIAEEWFEFQAAGPFTVEVAITYRAVRSFSGDGDASGDARNQNSFSLGETWQVVDAVGDVVSTQTWSPNYAELSTRGGGLVVSGSPLERATFTLQPGWRLLRSNNAEVTARADAQTWTSIFASSLKLSVSTRVAVAEGLASLSATSSLARYDGSDAGRLSPGRSNLQNGFLALLHPDEAHSGLEVSTDLINWVPVLTANRFRTRETQFYSVVPVSDTTPAFYRFSLLPAE